MSFDGQQGCLHVKFRVQDHSISQEDGAMYRYDALDVTQRRDTQYYFPIIFPRHPLQRQQLQDISDDPAMGQSGQLLIYQDPEVSHIFSPGKRATGLSLPELQKCHSLRKDRRYSTAPLPETN